MRRSSEVEKEATMINRRKILLTLLPFSMRSPVFGLSVLATVPQQGEGEKKGGEGGGAVCYLHKHRGGG